MFDDLLPNPGEHGLNRASMIFYVIATLTALAAGLKLILGIAGAERLSFVRIIVYSVFALLAFAIGRGIEGRKPWAKWVGYGYGVLELFAFPIGTLVGIFIILYIYRASKAGLFAPPLGTPVVFTSGPK